MHSKSMTELQVLQYNVHKRSDVMSLLLGSPVAQRFDIIAIQEPWINTRQNTTHCPAASPFTLVWSEPNSRSCLFVNKAIDPSRWEQRITSRDLCSVNIKMSEGELWIHSVYAQPPGSHATRAEEYTNPFSDLRELLEEQGNTRHIVVGDFNVHHPLWSGVCLPTAHSAAETLISSLYKNGCQSITPLGTKTFPTANGGTTIDLTFVSDALTDELLSCQIQAELDMGSDHLPVLSRFLLRAPAAQVKYTRAWKDTDWLQARELSERLLQATPLDTKEQLEHYSTFLSESVRWVIEQTVPIRQPSKYANPWWNQEVAEAVREARKARKRWLDTRIELFREEHAGLEDKKRRLIAQAKTACFRSFVHEATKKDGLWGLSRWAKGSLKNRAFIPALHNGDSIAREHTDKIEALRARFYPEPVVSSNRRPPLPDLPRFEVCNSITEEEILSILSSCSSRSAAGDDEVPFSFLKGLGPSIITAITALTNASWRLQHFPVFFRKARTVVIKKPCKDTYETASSWRPIALLKAIGKVVEKATARRIRDAAEKYGLLPPEQMGARAQRSTGTALELLTGLVQTVWKSDKRNVATLLSLDISGAFDTVVHRKLVEILTRSGFPRWICMWVQSFLTERETTLLVNGKESDPFQVRAGVPQGSPLSPILFLLYNAELFKICAQPKQGIHGLGFVDDLNIIAYSRTTAINCTKLSMVHDQCLQWAAEHGIAFAPKKYELIHFTTARKIHDLGACITLGDTVKAPTKEVRVLGVWLDPKLKWSAHAKVVNQKGIIALAGLQRIVASTWGASFARARLLFSAVVRPTLAYGAGVWCNMEGSNSVLSRARVIQNKGLRIVTGAFRATPARELKTEAFIGPFDIAAREARAQHIRSTYATGTGAFIKQECQYVCQRIWRSRGKRGQRPTSAPVINEREKWAEARKERHGVGQKAVLSEWTERWRAERGRSRWVSIASKQEPSKSRLQLHQELHKAESSLLIQARTGRIGLAHFLSKARVPGYESPLCRCGEGFAETAEHVYLRCSGEDERRTWTGSTKLENLISDPLRTKQAAKWLIQSDRLGQFRLAERLLYGENRASEV